jgi:uncharacterized protein with ParB-like and HNH nuclease domain
MNKNIYTKMSTSVGALLDFVNEGKLSVADSPFVWESNHVRDLFDSMYKGYPIGYFILSDKVIIDGNQRLLALYSVIKKTNITDIHNMSKRIRIAFNPVSEEFKATDAEIEKNKEFIPDISIVFQLDPYSVSYDFFEQYRTYNTNSFKSPIKIDIEMVKERIGKIFYLLAYEIDALIIKPEVSEEAISEALIRLNARQ